jgi:uncharacterized membrane protein YgaE (UPF0421/DUF939 family)
VTRFHKLAVQCAVIPLSVGVGVFLLWLATGWGWLALAGLAVLIGGFVAFLVGVVVLPPRSSAPACCC